MVRLWDVKSGKEIRRFQHNGGVEGVAVSPDGRRLLSSVTDGTVHLWDTESGQELARFEGHTDGALGVAYSPDGRYGLSSAKDGTLRLWRLPKPESQP
jgi:WD40 repeat protein